MLGADGDSGHSDKAGNSKPIVVPGQPESSELYLRITSTDAEQRMPPLDSGNELTEAEVQLLRDWIQQGAKWADHWAFIPPTRPEQPSVQRNGWVRNPIDSFVLSRLESEGLKPS